jgi:hypothetical protein
VWCIRRDIEKLAFAKNTFLTTNLTQGCATEHVVILGGVIMGMPSWTKSVTLEHFVAHSPW